MRKRKQAQMAGMKATSAAPAVINLAPRFNNNKKITKDPDESPNKFGGSLIVGKLERKGSMWEGGFQQRQNEENK